METLFGYDDLASEPARRVPATLLPTDRERLIARVIELNPTATAAFLSQFTTEQLTLYVEHLLSSHGPRGRDAIWMRPGDTPAVLSAQSAA